ncbi:MAG: PTS sugar transporter subunit IIA [Myxococcales bacterium]|jgi:mannose/fructose-specific phosphotransferase system component IIA|nr:PTS sugar transporter subunit IIA [Myxococcales bacterium]
MIGILLCCHGTMAQGFKDAAELIVGPQQKFEAVGIGPAQGRHDLKKALKAAMRLLGTDAGILILTDLPGGTPCNEAAMLLGPTVQMVAGFNMPILLRVLLGRSDGITLPQLTEDISTYGGEHIIHFTYDAVHGGAV